MYVSVQGSTCYITSKELAIILYKLNYLNMCTFQKYLIQGLLQLMQYFCIKIQKYH